MIKLYDLAGAEADRRFSPYCWRIRLALEHKRQAVETVPWRFTEKEEIAFSRQSKVPVILDGEKILSGSWSIAEYLEGKNPEEPSLFGGTGAKAAIRFIESWTDTVLMNGIFPFIIMDLFNHLDPKDREYFRTSREQRLEMTLEQLGATRESKIKSFQQSLEPLNRTLKAQPFIGGDQPNYGDYIVLGAFMWARSVSPFRLLQPNDPAAAWRARMLDRFTVARNSPGYDL
jgi:glutathione S-transferase